jgi:hypothetical protein
MGRGFRDVTRDSRRGVMVRQGAQEEVVKRSRRRVLVDETKRRWSWKVGGVVIGERIWFGDWR